jgi:hypothetical protein
LTDKCQTSLHCLFLRWTSRAEATDVSD